MGLYILTGSAQLTLLSAVTQSLAGRVAMLVFSLCLPSSRWPAGFLPLEQTLFQGAYPPIYDRPNLSSKGAVRRLHPLLCRARRAADPERPGHRDVSAILEMCAARAGQLLNLSSLANVLRISHNTAANWINALEATYIVFRLQPHFENFSKRLVKAPKLYFYDTGVLCSLLGIDRPDEIATHALRGGIFESWGVIGAAERKPEPPLMSPVLIFGVTAKETKSTCSRSAAVNSNPWK